MIAFYYPRKKTIQLSELFPGVMVAHLPPEAAGDLMHDSVRLGVIRVQPTSADEPVLVNFMIGEEDERIKLEELALFRKEEE